MGAVRSDGDGITIAVRLLPKAERDVLAGLESLADGREVVRARVRAVPQDGEANAALERLVAKSLNVPKSAVTIVAGHKQRIKQVKINGDPARLATAVAALLGRA